MPRKLTNFDRMWSHYPNPKESSAAAKATIGGAVDTPIVTNSCVARVSRAMNYAGHKIPAAYAGLWTLRGGDGLRYALRVRELRRYLERVFGRPNVSHDYAAPGGTVPEAMRGQQGIICFVVTTWTDATGHFDLWDGERCIHNAYFHEAASAHLWFVPGSAAPPHGGPPDSGAAGVSALSGAVGADAANDPTDVATVQRLLAAAGEDAGPDDGVAGPRMIAAIRHYQRGFLKVPDGRVDPGGRTWRKLLRLD